MQEFRRTVSMIRAVAGTAVVAMLAVGMVPVEAAAQAAGDRPLFLQAAGGASIGVSIRDLTADEIAAVGLSQPGGVRLEQVRPDSPAARAGLAAGDVVVSFDGVRVRSAREFARLVDETPPGRTVTLSLRRDGADRTVEITPEAQAGAFAQAFPQLRREIERGIQALPRTFSFEIDRPGAVMSVSPGRLGATLLPVDGQLAEYFAVTGGALVSSVTDGSPGADAGLRAGDVIVSIDGRSVASVTEVTRALRDAGDGASLRLGVVRDRDPLTLTVTLPERPRLRPVGPRGTSL
jgi:serine protease Do